MRKKSVFKAMGKGEINEEEDGTWSHERKEVIVSTRGKLGTPIEETLPVGHCVKTHRSQGGDVKIEEEPCEDDKKGGKELKEENECICHNNSESQRFPSEEAGPSGIDNKAYNDDSTGPKHTKEQIKKEEVKINMSQDDNRDDDVQVDNFHSKDLLSFAWQIAKGMVSNVLEKIPVESLVQLIIYVAVKCQVNSY